MVGLHEVEPLHERQTGVIKEVPMDHNQLFIVTGTVIETRPDGFRAAHEAPTFFLSGNLQGILDEEAACRIGFHVVAAGRIPAESTVRVSTDFGRMATITFTTTDGLTVIVNAMKADL